MEKDSITIHTDGGARGNPGPAACAYVINVSEEVFENSKYLGKTTNNIAEYSGVILALNFLIKNKEKIGDRDVIFYLDSELVVKQLIGAYRVKDEKLKMLFSEIFSLTKNLTNKLFFRHVPRSDNKRADFLVNQELDSAH